MCHKPLPKGRWKEGKIGGIRTPARWGKKWAVELKRGILFGHNHVRLCFWTRNETIRGVLRVKTPKKHKKIVRSSYELFGGLLPGARRWRNPTEVKNEGGLLPERSEAQPPVRRAPEREPRQSVTKKQVKRPAIMVTHTPICTLTNSRFPYLRMRIEWHVTRFLRISAILCCHFVPQASENGRTQRRRQKQGFLSVKSSYARLVWKVSYSMFLNRCLCCTSVF